MKKNLVYLMFMAALLGVTACGGDKKASEATEPVTESQSEVTASENNTQDSVQETENNDPSQSEEVSSEELVVEVEAAKPADIVFDHKYEGDYELAVVTAYDDQSNVMWKYETGKYDFTELDQTCELGICEDCYYLADGNEVVCLNSYNGDILWKCDGIGAENAACFDQAGNIYVASYYNPMLCKIDVNGKMVWLVEEYKDYMWPFEICMVDNDQQIKMGCYEVNGEPEETTINIDPATGKLQ